MWKKFSGARGGKPDLFFRRHPSVETDRKNASSGHGAKADNRLMFRSATRFNRDLSRWDIASLDVLSGRAEMFRCASSFDQALCWKNLSTEWNGLENIFCGSQGRFDPSCATEAQMTVSGCFSFDATLCASGTRAEQSEGNDEGQAWYLFTIPLSSNYVGAALNLILEVVIVLAVSEMFGRFESRRVSRLLRNGVDVRIEESNLPLLGEGLLVQKGFPWRVVLRFLVLVAIWIAEFSASGRTETGTVIQEALLVGGDVTIFDALSEGNRTSRQSWPFTFDTIDDDGPIRTHFSANYTDGPTGFLKEAEATCSNYYPSGAGLRQVALRGIFVENRLRASGFECLGNELVRVTESALLGGECSVFQLLNKDTTRIHWYGEREATRGGQAQNITVFTGEVAYSTCLGDFGGEHNAIIGINHQSLGPR